MTKKVISVSLQICNWDYNTLSFIKDKLEELIEKHGPEAVLFLDRSDPRYIEWMISFKRLETDQEEADRLFEEDEKRQIRKDMYLKLKEEFEDETKT